VSRRPTPTRLAETFWNGDPCRAVRGTATLIVRGAPRERVPVVAVSLGSHGTAYLLNPRNDTWVSMVDRQGQGIDPALINGRVEGFTPLYPDELYARDRFWETKT
jgi:hypothetical protein